MFKKNQKENVKALQVLLIAENYADTQSNFCLQPCPIECPLEKTLQQLERHEFKDIIIFASSHRREIESFVTKRKKKLGTSLRFIFGEGCRSFGDICRSIFNQKVIKEDFLIINANTISDINLNYLQKQYQIVSSRQKGMIMFKVFQKKPIHSQNKSFVLYDEKTNLIHYYEKFILDQKKKQFQIKENYRFPFKKLFKEQNKDQYTLSFDLIDTQITFCSNGILNTFNENFDHHSLRDHFIKEVLSSEISTEKIGITIIDETKCFHQVCDTPYDFYRCIINQIKSSYTYFYINNDDYDTEQFCKIISRQITIDFNTVFEGFIFLGKDCKIGQKVQIKNSIVQDKSEINDNSIIDNCFIYSNCKIGANAQLKNCYIMSSIEIKENEVLKDKIYNGEKWLDFSNQIEEQEDLLDDRSYCLDSDEEDMNNEINFQKEIEDTLDILQNDAEATPSVSLEIMNIKLSENKSFGECVEAMMIYILNKNISKDASAILQSLKKLKLYTELLLQYVKGEAEMRSLTNTLENYIKENKGMKIHLFLQHFFQEEILSSDYLIEWGNQKKDSEDEFNQNCYKLTQKFLDWLEEESEDESEEESEEEESEEDNQNFYFLQWKRIVGIILQKFGFIFLRYYFYLFLYLLSLAQLQTFESQLKEFVLFYLQQKLLFVNQDFELLLKIFHT